MHAHYHRRLWISQSLWRTVTRIDKSKINHSIAFRNALGVAVPLAIGIAIHNALAGVAIATGALNVSYSDGTDPYSQRARRMFAWTMLGGLAVFVGSVTGRNNWAAVIVSATWAFVAGLAMAVSTRAGDLGLNTLVSVVVFAARGAMSAEGAAAAGLLVIGGGLLQMIFALLFWPLHRYGPERRAISEVFEKLSQELKRSDNESIAAPLNVPSPQVQDVLTALGRDHSLDGERYRLIFDQADRMRLSTFVLIRLRSEMERQHRSVVTINRVLEASAQIIASVGQCLASDECITNERKLLGDLEAQVEVAHQEDASSNFPLQRGVSSAIDLLAGQLRVVASLAAHAITRGAEEFAMEEASHPWRLQLTNWIAIMRANLDPRSSYFRHAVRMGVCVGLGDVISRSIDWQRSYWLPMTIAVVLRPDYTTTISRGVMRLAGTFSGLLIATAVYHLFPPSALTQLFLVGVFMYCLRSVGAANYGVFSIAVSSLIVFLIAATGVPPKEVIIERALNTSAGGVLALIAYVLWPTWERTQVSDVMAEMLDACRNYFHAIVERFGQGPVAVSDLDDVRKAWRRARSNAEASVDRISSEPRINPEQLSSLTSMLASSHVLIYSMMGLEGALVHGHAHTPPETFKTFARDVEFTLYFLAASFRGSAAAFETLPQLREDHRRMLEARDRFAAGDEVILIETDRLTVTLNTLREQVMRYVGTPIPSTVAQ